MRPEGTMATIADDDVVEHFNFHQLTGANQSAGDLNIGLARSWVAGRVDCAESSCAPRHLSPARKLCRLVNNQPDSMRLYIPSLGHLSAIALRHLTSWRQAWSASQGIKPKCLATCS